MGLATRQEKLNILFACQAANLDDIKEASAPKVAGAFFRSPTRKQRRVPCPRERCSGRLSLQACGVREPTNCDERMQLKQRGYDIKRSVAECHHAVPVKEGGGSCGLDNLVTLCQLCHNKTKRTIPVRHNGYENLSP